MSVDVGSIEFWAGPDVIGGPDALEAPIISFIGAARDTLDIAVQELESEPIARAILAAKTSGVKVRVVLEADYLTVNTPVADPWQSGGQNQTNRDIYEALLRAKIPVTTDLNPEIFHQKFVVRDFATSSRAAVLTGSTNFTPTGVSSNLNHLVAVGSKRVAAVYEEEFEEIWTGTYGTNVSVTILLRGSMQCPVCGSRRSSPRTMLLRWSTVLCWQSKRSAKIVETRTAGSLGDIRSPEGLRPPSGWSNLSPDSEPLALNVPTGRVLRTWPSIAVSGQRNGRCGGHAANPPHIGRSRSRQSGQGVPSPRSDRAAAVSRCVRGWRPSPKRR